MRAGLCGCWREVWPSLREAEVYHGIMASSDVTMMMWVRSSAAHLVLFATMFSLAARSQVYRGVVRRFSDAVAHKPVRKSVSMEERAANRAARKERASKFLAQARGDSVTQMALPPFPAAGRSVLASRWVWYAGVAVPAGLIFWGYNDENSPPARFSDAIGMTDWISGWTDQFAQPSHEKLLPDWSQVSEISFEHFVSVLYSTACITERVNSNHLNTILYTILDAQCSSGYSNSSNARLGLGKHTRVFDMGSQTRLASCQTSRSRQVSSRHGSIL